MISHNRIRLQEGLKGYWMMARKKAGKILCIALTALCLAGCQNKEAGGMGENAEMSTGVSAQENHSWQEEGTITGKVTEINGKEITLALVEMPKMENETPGGGEEGNPPELPEGETMPERKEPPELPEGETMPEGEEPPEFSEGQTPPEHGQKEEPDGNGPGMMETTGEEQTITVSDETVYTMDERGESQEASLADIEEGSILHVKMDGETVSSIKIRKMQPGDQEQETEGGVS